MTERAIRKGAYWHTTTVPTEARRNTETTLSEDGTSVHVLIRALVPEDADADADADAQPVIAKFDIPSGHLLYAAQEMLIGPFIGPAIIGEDLTDHRRRSILAKIEGIARSLVDDAVQVARQLDDGRSPWLARMKAVDTQMRFFYSNLGTLSDSFEDAVMIDLEASGGSDD